GHGGGTGPIFGNVCSYNVIPYFTDSNADNSRASSPPTNYTPTTFNSAGNLVLDWIPETAVPPPPPAPPVATPDTISGVTVNGATVAAGTLKAIIDAAPANATVALHAVSFIGTTDVPQPVTISGQGMGKTTINALNLEPTEDKAIIVPTVSGMTIQDLTLANAAISQALGLNAAGIRQAGAGIGFTARRVEITNCQNGMLTFGGPILVDSCNIHDNGAGAGGGGNTHEMYFSGSPTDTVTVTNTDAKCGALS